MAAHTVTSDANPARIQLRESSKDSLGQLLRHVAVHVVSVVVRGLGSIDVEAGTGAKVPRIVLSRNIQSSYRRNLALAEVPERLSRCKYHGAHTGAGVRVQHCNSLFACTVLEESLLGAVVGSTGQSRQINQDGDLLRRGLRRQVEVKVHLALGGFGGMAEFQQFAAKGRDCGFRCDRHIVAVFRMEMVNERGKWGEEEEKGKRDDSGGGRILLYYYSWSTMRGMRGMRGLF